VTCAGYRSVVAATKSNLGGDWTVEGESSKQFPGAKKTSKPFEKAVCRPSVATPSGKGKEVALSNSFAHIGLEDAANEEFTLHSPITFLDVFEKALSSNDRGKMRVGEDEVRGFSPTPAI
jgi:hypothetical protein